LYNLRRLERAAFLLCPHGCPHALKFISMPVWKRKGLRRSFTS
jgi:hypothetical protein